jgi:hypothetical protein
MEASIGTRKAFAVTPVFILLFFFNTCGLPQGISLSLLLLPVWLYLLHIHRRLSSLGLLLAPMFVFACVHLVNGADLFYYILSAAMLLGTGIFAIAAWPALSDPALDYAALFRKIIRINAVLTLLSLPFLFVPALKESVWYVMSMSEGIQVIPRLKLFTYEASHYSYLIAPLFIYVASVIVFCSRKMPDASLLLVLIGVPLLLSLSFGVLGALFISGLLAVLLRFRAVFYSRKRVGTLIAVLVTLGIGAFLLLRVFPDNMLTQRLLNILEGKDTSARGRTYESFILAQKIISGRSQLWGIGPGQLKLEGRNIIVQYYSYSKIPDSVRIPNACAETLVCFGYIGLTIRLAVQLILFFTTRVYRSPFRLWLFLFLFIFQFTGSYITNVTEYVYWMIAFAAAPVALGNRSPAGITASAVRQ